MFNDLQQLAFRTAMTAGAIDIHRRQFAGFENPREEIYTNISAVIAPGLLAQLMGFSSA